MMVQVLDLHVVLEGDLASAILLPFVLPHINISSA
jgi:hypothetical protein